MLDPDNNSGPGLKSFVTFRLAIAQNKLNAQATHILKSHSDLSLVDWRILQLLRHLDGASMSELASEVHMDKGQLSRKVRGMAEKGLLITTPDAHDNRMQHLHLTPTAHALSRRLLPIMQRRQAMLVEGATEAELETFFAVLARIDTAAAQRDID